MKKIAGIIICLLVLLVCACAFADVEINEAHFPDLYFRIYVQGQFDTDGNGCLSDAEIAEVTSIDLEETNVADLKGIEYFTALNRLMCMGGGLTELDVSRNTALTFLWCEGNCITELDVSKNTKLRELYCTRNGMKKLTLGKNAALDQVDCGHNNLVSLDISGCPKLVKMVSGRALSHLAFYGIEFDGWCDNEEAEWPAQFLFVDQGIRINTGIKDTVQVNGLKYTLNHTKKTATVTGVVKKTITKAVIPATVKANGTTYKVTSVAEKALSGLKKLTSLEIGKNVDNIGTKAFYNCGKLKDVTIKTTKLSAKNVGADAFGGEAKKAVYKCPAKKLKAYRKWLPKKGIPKTAVIRQAD